MSYAIIEFVFFLIIDSKAKGPECKILPVSNLPIISFIDEGPDTVVNQFIHTIPVMNGCGSKVQ